MERQPHGNSAGQRKKIGHVFGELPLKHGIIVAGAKRQMHSENLVAIEQLVDRLHGQRHLILRVFDNVTDFATRTPPLALLPQTSCAPAWLNRHPKWRPDRSDAVCAPMTISSSLTPLPLRRRQSDPDNSRGGNHVFQKTQISFLSPNNHHAQFQAQAQYMASINSL